jgi:hypothetical protein
MKAQRWINLLITIILIVLVYSEKPSRLVSLPMAIDFEQSSGNQVVSFGDVSALKNLTTKTLCAWINAESFDGGFNFISGINQFESLGLAGGYSLLLRTGQIRFVVGWTESSGDVAYWDSNDALSTGSWIHVCVTYDNSATANNPIIYVNGLSVALTEIQAPSGTLVDSGGITVIGNSNSASPFDGKISDVRVYNRILTPAEVLDMYNRRSMNDNINGLVFNPVLYGAAACQAFDGTALATANKIVDPYSGAIGTPSGSPVGAGETYLTVCP